ncbi:MAG: AI-2E family transporter [Solirubrobacteraceae bacterium]|jgi:predicted PurR-regulated permease PerM
MAESSGPRRRVRATRRDEPESVTDGIEEPTQEAIDEIRARAEVEADASPEHAYGKLGEPFDWDSPFLVGFTGALGVGCALAIGYLVVQATQVLVLVGLAFFLAVGLDPAVRWLYRRGIPRPLAVTIVVLAAVALFAGFLATAVPVITTQASHLADALPHYLHQLNERNTQLGKLNRKYHVTTDIQKLLRGNTSFGAVVGVGKIVLDLVASVILVMIVTVYVLADLPRVRRGIYLLAPSSRRARMVLLTDEILDRVGGYVLGNLLTSFIAGFGTWVWALALGIPYALLLGILVALLDLIPVVGSTIGGIIVALVGLTISLPVAIATAIFYFVYRFVEDYLLTPRVMARTVDVPGLVTVIATIIGGALLGIIGALVAIPVAAAIKLLVEQLGSPRLERS